MTEERRVVVVREAGAGVALILLAEFAGAATSVRNVGQVLLVAIGCGLAAALASDWLSRAALTVLALAIFVAFADYRGGSHSWSCTPLIGFAVILGAGYRRLRHLEMAPD